MAPLTQRSPNTLRERRAASGLRPLATLLSRNQSGLLILVQTAGAAWTNEVEEVTIASAKINENIPAKWSLLILLADSKVGQQSRLHISDDTALD